MKKKVLKYLLTWFVYFLPIVLWLIWTNVSAATGCNWIKLNTNFPIIWNCIETTSGSKTDPTNVFPVMMWWLSKIIVSLILVVCFILVIVAWIMRASDKPWAWTWGWAKWLLAKVAITVLLLWFSWAILRLVNPNFFG